MKSYSLIEFDEIDQDVRTVLLQESISECITDIMKEMDKENFDDIYLNEDVKYFFEHTNPEQKQEINDYMKHISKEIHEAINFHIMIKFFGFTDIVMQKYKVKMLNYIEIHGLPQKSKKPEKSSLPETSTSSWFCNIL